MDGEERRLAAISAIQRVQAEREVAFRPLCTDCRFGPLAGAPDRCEHFAHWEISPDRRLRIPVTTGMARSEKGLCGPEASLFQPYRGLRRVARWAHKNPEPALQVVFWAILGSLVAIGALVIAIRGAW